MTSRICAYNACYDFTGSQVIEEERKRVQELKRRVQDEVRAQWEERRQREANCNSLNSVGSEESSLTSSDVPTER